MRLVNLGYHYNLPTLKRHLLQHPLSTSEILMQINNLQTLAIIINDDTPKTKALARQRRFEYLEKFSIDLPIIIYQPEMQFTAVYTAAEQRLDDPLFFLTRIKNLLQAHANPPKFLNRLTSSFVISETIQFSIDFRYYKLSPTQAMSLLNIIVTQIKHPEAALQAAMSLLEQTHTPHLSLSLSPNS